MIKNIAILGAGTMGVAIAESFARFDYSVTVYEPAEEVRQTVLLRVRRDLALMEEYGLLSSQVIEDCLDKIVVFSDLASAVADADLVIESAVEVLGIKQKLFADLVSFCTPDCIFSTNSSSLSLNDITALLSVENQQRCMVTHFFNPAHIVPLVELSCFAQTSEAMYQRVEALFLAIEKQPVKICKDINGLVANRIQTAVLREALSLAETGVASLQDIDKVITHGLGFRYAAAGCIEISDMGGLDIWNAVCDNLLPSIDSSQTTNRLLKAKFAGGELGLKTGQGFYRYTDSNVARVNNQFQKRLLRQLNTLQADEHDTK